MPAPDRAADPPASTPPPARTDAAPPAAATAPGGAAVAGSATGVETPPSRYLPESDAGTGRGRWRVAAMIMIAITTFLAFQNGDGLSLVGAWLGGSLLLIVAIAFWHTRQARRFNAGNLGAVAALLRGEHERAAAYFARWSARSPATVSVVARHNLAWTRMRQGRPREAIELFAQNETHVGALRASTVHATSAVDLALCHALLDDPVAAGAWLTEASRRKRVAFHHDAMTSFVRGVLACRDGRHGDAANDLADHWAEYEAVLAGDLLRPLRILRAFALAAAGPREAGMAHQFLVKPAYPDELTFLAVEWPEMATFLAAHDLAPSTLAPALVAPPIPDAPADQR